MSVRTALLPLTPLYRLGLALRERRLASGREPIRRLRFPVISVGNLSTGGAGKTPLTIALARGLMERGFAVDVLSRGYGRQSGAAARVRIDGTADEFGDEPLLIARRAGVPVFVASQRFAAGVVAESELEPGAQSVHILDDGFQHAQLHRDVDIVLLNGVDLRDRLLPAGNLRENLGAVGRAHVIAIPAHEPEIEAEIRGRGWDGAVWRLRRRMEIPPVDGAVLAFCGIARPEQFFAGLEHAGINIVARQAFRDHHRYTSVNLDRLVARARAAGASALVTTEKDAVRLAGMQTALPLIMTGLRIEISDEASALEWLISRVAPGSRS